jgi:hypothetical protein
MEQSGPPTAGPCLTLQRNTMDCGWHILYHMPFPINNVQCADMHTHVCGDMIAFRSIVLSRILRSRNYSEWRKFITEDDVDPTHDDTIHESPAGKSDV